MENGGSRNTDIAGFHQSIAICCNVKVADTRKLSLPTFASHVQLILPLREIAQPVRAASRS